MKISFQNPCACFVLILAAFCLASVAQASCVLPVPDGGDETHTPANIEGDIVSIKKEIVVIKALNTNKKVSVRVPKNKPIYSAFGGDAPSSDLRVGQKVWVWFVGCKVADTKIVPVAAYFQIYSTDPNDRP